jgi:uncharacterized protein with von Willebrand factor type A (vWA) domain
MQTHNIKLTKQQMADVLNMQLTNFAKACRDGRLTVGSDGLVDLGGAATLIYIRNRHLKTYQNVREPSQRQTTEAFKHFGLTAKRIKELENERVEKEQEREQRESERFDMQILKEEEKRLKVEKLKKEVALKEIEICKENGSLVERQGLAKICFAYLDLFNRGLFQSHKRQADYLINLIQSKGAKCRQQVIKYLDNEDTKKIKKIKKELEKVMDEIM